jgi:hypothetical protein
VSFFPAKSPILNFTINCDMDRSRTASTTICSRIRRFGGKKWH